ncbi:hypothetical protein [Nocardia carnea]|uniref:hypothetical protein n=1 Tax=Nocardia carnea TaxID=37328 RepID=UPI002453EAA3|nr:hypothetical protein [Nocardia carnea]
MSSKNPSSDPVEPEGTGVPADDAAEHTTAGSSSADSAAGTAEPTGAGESADKASGASAESDTTAKVEKSDSDATAKAGLSAASDAAGKSGDLDATAKSEAPADPDATVKVEKPTDPDTTVKVDKPADSDATVRVDKPTDPDATVKVDKTADADATAKNDRPDSAGSGEKEPADPGETVVLGKESPAGEATVALGKSGSGKPAGSGSDDTEKLERSGASGTGAAAKKSSGRRSRFPLPVLAAAAVLLIAAVVAVGVFFYLANDRQSELDRRAAATKAACDFGNSFATYTGDKADDYVSRLDQNATGEWKKLVSQIGPDLKARFAETQVNSTAAEVQCGYESGDGDKARVVLVIDQQFTTAGGPQQQAPGRVKVAANVDMEKVDGRWMVANFDTPMMQQ